MRKGRYINIISPAFVVGAIIGQLFCIPIVSFFTSCIICISLAYITYSRKSQAAMIAAFMAAGIATASVGGISRENLSIFIHAAKIKAALSQKIENMLPQGEEEAIAVTKALAIGDKSDLSRSLKEDYRKSGASHILALSGLHVGVMYALVSLMLSVLGNGRTMKIVRKSLSLSLLWYYAIITGLSSSISRAAIMITAYQISDFFKAERNLAHALALSAMLITIVKPSAPFEIGFQLSYAAMLSICYIFPFINRLLKCRTRILKYVWNMLSLSIACQAGTAPLSYIYFGSFPKYFMLTNLFAIPITSAIMYMIPVVSLCSAIPEAGIHASAILSATIKLLNAVLKIIASLN